MLVPLRRGGLLLAVVVVCLLAACGGSGSDADAPRPSATEAHKIRTVDRGGAVLPATDTVTLSFPVTWEVHGDGSSKLDLHEGTDTCAYSAVARVAVVPLDEGTAADAARFVVPTADGRLLEAGHRGSAAWRVVKLHGDGIRQRLDAVRAQPLRFLSSQRGRPMWLVTRITARSDPGDECHAGTYREVLGPRIGDALATLRTRG